MREPLPKAEQQMSAPNLDGANGPNCNIRSALPTSLAVFGKRVARFYNLTSLERSQEFWPLRLIKRGIPVVVLQPIFFIPPFVVDAGKMLLKPFGQASLKFGEPISSSAFCGQQRHHHTPPFSLRLRHWSERNANTKPATKAPPEESNGLNLQEEIRLHLSRCMEDTQISIEHISDQGVGLRIQLVIRGPLHLDFH
jgi:hypothetical protein